MHIEFDGEIWYWHGPAPWYFVTVPPKECADIKTIASSVTYGWGMIPVTAQIGQTHWQTAMFPKDERYILPIKANIRKAENLKEGDPVNIQLEIG